MLQHRDAFHGDYANGARDAQFTGFSSMHINEYAFRHHVLGQIPVQFHILAPCSFVFPIRLHQVSQAMPTTIPTKSALSPWLSLKAGTSGVAGK